MKSRILRQLGSIVLLAALLLMLAGCAAKPETAPDSAASQTHLTLSERNKDAPAQNEPKSAEKPAKKQSARSEKVQTPAAVSGQDVSALQNDESLLTLRGQLSSSGGAYLHFAAAYLGYVGGLFDEGFEAGFPVWLEYDRIKEKIKEGVETIPDIEFSDTIPTEELEAKFIAEAKAAGMSSLKGHRSVGGIRASIYNAFPMAGVDCLVDFMKEFERKNG